MIHFYEIFSQCGAVVAYICVHGRYTPSFCIQLGYKMFPICLHFSRVHVRRSPKCRNPHAVPLFNLGYMFRIIGMPYLWCMFCCLVCFYADPVKNKIGLKSARNYLTTLCPLKNTLYHYKDFLPKTKSFYPLNIFIFLNTLIYIFSYFSFSS